jgi:glycolate oxidase iron-sulfur subunit
MFTGNVGCLMQITRHLKSIGYRIRTAHPIDAVWASYSGDLPEELAPREVRPI